MNDELKAIIRAQYLELELDSVRYDAKRRARRAFEVGLWVGTALAGTAALGVGYALGVQSKMTPPTGEDAR